MSAKTKPMHSAGQFETGEPTIYEAAIRPWDVLVDLRKARGFHYRIQHLNIPGIILYRDLFEWDTRVQGMSPPNTLSIGIPINAGENSRFWAAPAEEARVYSSLPTCFDAHFSAGQGHMVALVDLSVAGKLGVEPILERTAEGPGHMEWSQEQRTISSCANHMQRILDAVSRQPEGLGHAASVQAISDDLTQCLRRVAGASEDVGPVAGKALSHAMEYLNAVNPFCATVTDLCAEAGLHRRALERATRDTFDCTVRDFLRRRRFHNARRLLLADAQSSTITSIALELGFYDVGRFARDYFKLFGEKPSQTVRNRTSLSKTMMPFGIRPA